ncbi:MAG: hypothetical protein M3243_02565 [Thermoproteota archaeon]|nr:hypothetical protein [Thermoproteota archaeon]
MAKAKSKQKKGKRTDLSKVRKKGNIKKKATTKVRKGSKKKTVRRKAVPRSKATRVETVSNPAAFTEIASEEVTLSTPDLGEQETIGSAGVNNSEFTSTDDNR